jgi:hypothetical protein
MDLSQPGFQPDVLTPYKRTITFAPADLEGGELRIVATDGTVSIHGPGPMTVYLDLDEARDLASLLLRAVEVGIDLIAGRTRLPDGRTWDQWRASILHPSRSLADAAIAGRHAAERASAELVAADQAAHGAHPDGGSLFFTPDGTRRNISFHDRQVCGEDCTL